MQRHNRDPLLTDMLFKQQENSYTSGVNSNKSIDELIQSFTDSFLNEDFERSLEYILQINTILSNSGPQTYNFNINLILFEILTRIYNDSSNDTASQEIAKNIWTFLQLSTKVGGFHDILLDINVFEALLYIVNVNDDFTIENILRFFGIILQDKKGFDVFVSSNILNKLIKYMLNLDITQNNTNIHCAILNFLHFLQVILVTPDGSSLLESICEYVYEIIPILVQKLSDNLDIFGIALNIISESIKYPEGVSNLSNSNILTLLNELLNNPKASSTWKQIISIYINLTSILSSNSEEYQNLLKIIPIERIIKIYNEQPFDPQASSCLQLLNNLIADNKEMAQIVNQILVPYFINVFDEYSYSMKCNVSQVCFAAFYQGEFNLFFNLLENGVLEGFVDVVSNSSELQKYFCMSMLRLINSAPSSEIRTSLIDITRNVFSELLENISESSEIEEVDLLFELINDIQ
ncbi:hypothetical protein TVAG_291590 [Trichomonas vaginalis G3]|uniref:Uncharacterized protein n=1 Tax=Trichomonas vaginalis (strain ATCC PRA-98 / G3) TaxID=412133 RepID=A2DQU0_TRIV3|nr:armadillo (ARM) repeat-containing protein family [Trichomonas vaginalis G3]EAY17207.1 hypothetical protein TVAG_291590 [Trichomonas vaginalis G3]KAI5486260.1 armadillo (ARM) repeat-containing protein family [Trichomonas vaginalis G3]|eukprot:XP_001329430.1 hypothetical protein [Trichomonas vaginalis G3]